MSFCLAFLLAQDPNLDFFERKVRPLLSARCYECHSAQTKKLRGNLRLDSRAGWERGGDSGPAIVPGNPDASLVVRAVRYGDPDLQMPPKEKLPDEEVAVLVEWVKRGAADPRDKAEALPAARTIDLEAARNFWSLRPVVDPPADSIDHFIVARLRAARLEPGPDAAPAALLRRLTFDLTGLPPTPEDIVAFERDPSLEPVVDRLLASPRFGERWGRHWLDVARFAESSGGGRSLMFKNAWRYRDYVIDAFNADVPFDRFIREQIAGDLLEAATPADRNRRLTAVGFLMLGPINYEEQDKEALRLDVVDEQIETVGRAFLGLTLGCARCHDHKFDPIPTADYYALAGIFGGTTALTPGNVSGYIEHELDDPSSAAWRAHQKELDEAEVALARARGGSKSAGKNFKRAELPGIVLDDTDTNPVGDWVHSTHTAGYVEKGYIHDQGRPKGEMWASFAPEIREAGLYEVRLSYTTGSGRATNVPVTIESAEGRTTVRVNQREAPPAGGIFVSLGRFRFAAGMEGIITISNEGTDGVVIVDSVQVLPAAAAPPPEAGPAADASKVAELEARIKELKKNAPPEPARAMGVKDDAKPADGHVRIRGLPRHLGPKVPRGFVTVAVPPSVKHPPAIPAGRSGRVELAEWIAAPDNPLAARVYVNRVWLHLLGEGLVRTPDNFGAVGETPSHPELLDWLAARFREGGGSTKKLVRRIVLSRVYRRAASAPTDADPENRLLSHAHRRRLEAEAIRDAMLSIAGRLDLTAGGSTIVAPAEYDYGYAKLDSTRRSVYIPFFRNSMLELFSVFDGANPSVTTGRRSATNVPAQALFLMNSPWVMEQSRLAAARVEQEPEAERLDLVYRFTLGRLPSADERRLATEHLARAGPGGWTGLMHALFACLDFRHLN